MTTKKSNERKEEEVREDVRDETSSSTPNPLWQSGNVSTTGEGLTTEDVSPIFARARAEALGAAVDAVKSGDKHPEGVVLPEDGDDKSNEEAVADLKDAAKEAQKKADDQAKNGSLPVETSDDSKSANAKSDADKADEAKKASGN